MLKSFYNKDGSLTEYALSCGHVQEARQNKDAYVYLEKQHGVYHVKALIHGVQWGEDWNETKARQWFTFSKLAQAKACFKKLVAEQKEIIKTLAM